MSIIHQYIVLTNEPLTTIDDLLDERRGGNGVVAGMLPDLDWEDVPYPYHRAEKESA